MNKEPIHRRGYGFHRGPILQLLYYSPAPNFGKTCGIPKSPALAGSYEGAKGFSEIGGRERTPKQGFGDGMKSEILQAISVSPMRDRAMALAH